MCKIYRYGYSCGHDGGYFAEDCTCVFIIEEARRNEQSFDIATLTQLESFCAQDSEGEPIPRHLPYMCEPCQRKTKGEEKKRKAERAEKIARNFTGRLLGWLG